MEKPSVSTCSGFCVSFSAIVCFSVVLCKQEEEKFSSGENFSEGFPETVCTLLRNSMSLIWVHRCVVQGRNRNVIDFYIFRDYDNCHGDGDHYWLLFISHFHFLGTNLFSTQAPRKLPEDPSKATWAWKNQFLVFQKPKRDCWGCCHTNFSSNYAKIKWWNFFFSGLQNEKRIFISSHQEGKCYAFNPHDATRAPSFLFALFSFRWLNIEIFLWFPDAWVIIPQRNPWEFSNKTVTEAFSFKNAWVKNVEVVFVSNAINKEFCFLPLTTNRHLWIS